MKESTREKLRQAEHICNQEDRSTEYMIQFMQDYAGVDFDCVMKYLRETSDNNGVV